MRRLLILAGIVAVPLLELWVAIWAVGQFGWSAVLVVAAVVFGFGIAMMRRALVGWADAANRATQDEVYRNERFSVDFASSTLLFIGAILMIIPGFITGIAGLILILPPLRSWLAHSFGSRLTQFTADRGYQRVVIIEGETVVRDSGGTSAPGQNGPASSGARIITGEIVGPDEDQGPR